MAIIQIGLINESTVVADSEVQTATTALQQQVNNDFAPAWGLGADLVFIPKGAEPPATAWWLVVLDNSDQAGALGYHDLTPNGLPMGKIFAGTDLQYGSKWTVTASHELLEMLGDPDINLCASVANEDGSLRLYAYEVADACEADQNAYAIGDVWVSDFVYPAWFESFREPNSTQFDKQNRITAPFQLLPGGYIGILDTTSTHGWTQLTAQGAPPSYELRAGVGSRRERRRTIRSHWMKSSLRRKPRAMALAPAGPGARIEFNTYRNPVLSLLQSALNESINKRTPAMALARSMSSSHPAMQQFHAAIKMKVPKATLSRQDVQRTMAAMPTAAAPVALTCAEMYAEMGWAEITGNTARRDALANEIKFSTCDALWAESVTTYLAWRAAASKIPYIPCTNMSDFVVDLPKPQGGDGRLVIGVIGDWGTGMSQASFLLNRMLNKNPDLIIHLGDIYYAGTPSEVTRNFAQVLDNSDVTVPVYTLAGNHDMYSGGMAYYSLLQQLRQPASFFCLRNAAWQILGLDTGYHDSDVFTVNTNLTFLEPSEEAWHLDKTKNANGRKTILMSHHQLFSPYGDGVGQDPNTQKGLITNPKLLNTFGGVMGNIALWIWGHEHSFNLFQPYAGLNKGRCLGASAVPELGDAYAINTGLDNGTAPAFPALITGANDQPIQLQKNPDDEYYHCYAVLRLDSAGGESVAEYYQMDSANCGPEALLYQEQI